MFRVNRRLCYRGCANSGSNGATYAGIGEGLQRPLWAFRWALGHHDSRINRLAEQVNIAERDNVVGFQKNKCDMSDAGKVLYWITGANIHNGYRTPDIYDVNQLLPKLAR